MTAALMDAWIQEVDKVCFQKWERFLKLPSFLFSYVKGFSNTFENEQAEEI